MMKSSIKFGDFCVHLQPHSQELNLPVSRVQISRLAIMFTADFPLCSHGRNCTKLLYKFERISKIVPPASFKEDFHGFPSLPLQRHHSFSSFLSVHPKDKTSTSLLLLPAAALATHWHTRHALCKPLQDHSQTEANWFFNIRDGLGLAVYIYLPSLWTSNCNDLITIFEYLWPLSTLAPGSP